MVKKIITIMIIFQIIFVPISNAGFWDEIINHGDKFISNGTDLAKSSTDVDQAQLDKTINRIYNLLLGLGISVSVIVGAILGIKIMVGSVEEQAKTKEKMIPYIAGCVATFGGFGIWKLLIVILSKV